MALLRIDPHAHLYDTYSLEQWCQAAAANLGVSKEIIGAVIVVDREGQDSFERLRREFGGARWVEAIDSNGDQTRALSGEISVGDSHVTMIRGVQYISSERLEVLGLGVCRSVPDGAGCSELIARINSEGGVACLPWSPGKWLGKRGKVMSSMLSRFTPDQLIVGDIAMRTAMGPPSLLLHRARAAGFRIVTGTDPLPRPEDATLVGSYGIQLPLESPALRNLAAASVVGIIKSNISMLSSFGRPNNVFTAAARFLSTFRAL